jgi:enoyl-CoA hydratase
MTFECIVTELRGSGTLKTALITLNRPKQLNALNDTLMDELGAALKSFDADEGIGCIVVTGSDKAFAAGADIGAMASWSYMDVYKSDYITRNWETIRSVRKPVIAAVAGFALGGGCELAMMCDFIIAADTAKFGQPEIKLGIIPGFGGTQRLPRLVGENKALEMNLVGDPIGADEAVDFGLVNRVVPDHELLDSALAWARRLAEQAPLAVEGIKGASAKGDLDEGIEAEKAAFTRVFGSADGREGIAAFLGKRKPHWTGE